MDVSTRELVAAREVGAFGGQLEVRVARPQVGNHEPDGAALADGQRRQRAVLLPRIDLTGIRAERDRIPDAGRAPGPEARARREVGLQSRAVGSAGPRVLDRDVERAPVSAQPLRRGGGAQVRAVLGLIAGAVSIDVGLGDRLDRQRAAALDLACRAAVGDRGTDRRAVDVDGLRVADIALAILGRAADLRRDRVAARLLLDPVADVAVVGEDVRCGEGVGARLGRQRHRLAGVDRRFTLLPIRRERVHEEADRAGTTAGLDHHVEAREQLGLRTLVRLPAVPVAVERRRAFGRERVGALRREREQRERRHQEAFTVHDVRPRPGLVGRPPTPHCLPRPRRCARPGCARP